jgi:hypothetical protein
MLSLYDLADIGLMRAYLLAASLAASLAAPAILQAQTVDPRLIPILTGSVGRTVRIQLDAGSSMTTGAIERVRGDTPFLTTKSGIRQTLSVPGIARVDIREPLSADARLRRTRLGAAAGVLIGAVIGYEIAKPRVRRAERQDDVPLAQIDYLIDPLVGAVVGGAIGAASGNVWRDHWVTRYPKWRNTVKDSSHRLSVPMRMLPHGLRRRAPAPRLPGASCRSRRLAS